MRVPLFLVIPLALATVAAAWFFGTRNIDFLKEPSPEHLESIRKNALPARPALSADVADAGTQNNGKPPPELPPPTLNLGNLSVSPALSAYRPQAEKDPAEVQTIAAALEAKGSFQRALLAWERLLDTAKADDAQQTAALAAIHKLRPTLPAWNIDPAGAMPIRLHLGTSPSVSKKIQPVLNETAALLATVSSGILQVEPVLTVGKQASEKGGNPPVAIWLSGPTDQSQATDVISFAAPSDPDQLRLVLLRTIYRLTTSHLTHLPQIAAPTALAENENPVESLTFRITRLAWWELANSLSRPQTPPPAKP